jgi:hypothetical protein
MTHSHGAPGTICVLTNSKIIGPDVADAAREKIGVFMKMRGGMPYFRLPQSGSRMKSQLLSSVLCALSAHLSSSQVSSLSSYSTVLVQLYCILYQDRKKQYLNTSMMIAVA